MPAPFRCPRTLRNVLLAVILLFTAASALYAVTRSEILRTYTYQDFVGQCCFGWNRSVKVTEPTTVSPVVITWSFDYWSSYAGFVGLMVNSGPCQYYGAGEVPYQPQPATKTYHWIVYPSDGLVSGANTFQVCGGSQGSPTDHITVLESALAARTGN